MQIPLASILHTVLLADEPDGVRLSAGQLIIPEWYRPTGGKVDLLLHFHGTPVRVSTCLEESQRAAAAAVVTYDGLSGVYRKPFAEDRQLFGRILDEARVALAARFGMRHLEIDWLVVTSFSAGYGAVREILKEAEYAARVTDLIMLDSIYAGYAEDGGRRVVDPADMGSFEAMARRAADGKANMWVTHCEERPGSYASTTEVAEYLAAKLGVQIEPASGVDPSGMHLLSQADLGGFHIRGYTGTGSQAHLSHLLSMGMFLKWSSLRER